MANPNPNFFGFFWMGSNTKTNMWMDWWMLTEETLESDTKMIWGGPIFSVSGGAMMDMVMNTMNTKITCMNLRISPARSLMPMQQLSTL